MCQQCASITIDDQVKRQVSMCMVQCTEIQSEIENK